MRRGRGLRAEHLLGTRHVLRGSGTRGLRLPHRMGRASLRDLRHCGRLPRRRAGQLHHRPVPSEPVHGAGQERVRECGCRIHLLLQPGLSRRRHRRVHHGPLRPELLPRAEQGVSRRGRGGGVLYARLRRSEPLYRRRARGRRVPEHGRAERHCVSDVVVPHGGDLPGGCVPGRGRARLQRWKPVYRGHLQRGGRVPVHRGRRVDSGRRSRVHAGRLFGGRCHAPAERRGV